MANPLLELKTLGQSVWLDDIDRGQLQDEGVQRFADSFDKLFQCIESKRKAIKQKTIPRS